MNDERSWPWRIAADTVRGASHGRRNQPNQDALQCYRGEQEGLPIIVAISDGHGDAAYFRSARGASLAVATAIEVMRHFVEESPVGLTALSRQAADGLPQTLVRTWRLAVEADLAEHPVQEDELTLVETVKGAASRRRVEDDPIRAYGATLLVLAVAEAFALALAIGDGDILGVDAGGDVTTLVPRDQGLLGTEVHSLCSPAAWNLFRPARLLPLANDPPALFLICTDGYPTSFATDADFYQLGPDFLTLIRERGLYHVQKRLPAILFDASQRGSGDDITFAMIKRTEESDHDWVAFKVAAGEESVSALAESEADARLRLRADLVTLLEQTAEQLESKVTELNSALGETQSGLMDQGVSLEVLEQTLTGLRNDLDATNSTVLLQQGRADEDHRMLEEQVKLLQATREQASALESHGNALAELTRSTRRWVVAALLLSILAAIAGGFAITDLLGVVWAPARTQVTLPEPALPNETSSLPSLATRRISTTGQEVGAPIIAEPDGTPAAPAITAPGVETDVPTTIAPDTAPGSDLLYIIRPGDTLVDIAAEFGVTVDAIMVLNELTSSVIHPGDHLVIPRH